MISKHLQIPGLQPQISKVFLDRYNIFFLTVGLGQLFKGEIIQVGILIKKKYGTTETTHTKTVNSRLYIAESHSRYKEVIEWIMSLFFLNENKESNNDFLVVHFHILRHVAYFTGSSHAS